MFIARHVLSNGRLQTAVLHFDKINVSLLSLRNTTHKKCPICQEKLNSTDDSWVLSEIPKADEVNEKILSELSGLTKESSDDE